MHHLSEVWVLVLDLSSQPRYLTLIECIPCIHLLLHLLLHHHLHIHWVLLHHHLLHHLLLLWIPTLVVAFRFIFRMRVLLRRFVCFDRCSTHYTIASSLLLVMFRWLLFSCWLHMVIYVLFGRKASKSHSWSSSSWLFSFFSFGESCGDIGWMVNGKLYYCTASVDGTIYVGISSPLIYSNSRQTLRPISYI